MTVGESPVAAQMPHQAKDGIMHSALKNGTNVIMASDNLGTGSITKGNQFSMTIECGSNQSSMTPGVMSSNALDMRDDSGVRATIGRMPWPQL